MPCACVAGPGSGSGVPTMCHVPTMGLVFESQCRHNIPPTFRRGIQDGWMGRVARNRQSGWRPNVKWRLGTSACWLGHHEIIWRQIGCLYIRWSIYQVSSSLPYCLRQRLGGHTFSQVAQPVFTGVTGWTHTTLCGIVGSLVRLSAVLQNSMACLNTSPLWCVVPPTLNYSGSSVAVPANHGHQRTSLSTSWSCPCCWFSSDINVQRFINVKQDFRGAIVRWKLCKNCPKKFGKDVLPVNMSWKALLQFTDATLSQVVVEVVLTVSTSKHYSCII